MLAGNEACDKLRMTWGTKEFLFFWGIRFKKCG
jgi:hypothetical protein